MGFANALFLFACAFSSVASEEVASKTCNKLTFKKIPLAEVPEDCTILHLHDYNMDDEQVVGLAETLKTHPNVVELNLWRNKLTGPGAKALSEMLAVNTVLKELWMGNNDVSDEGAFWLAEGLKKNTVLEQLDLDNNEVSETGATALVGALAENTSLKMLRLNYNLLKDEGAIAIGTQLHQNNGLEELWMISNDIGENGVAAFAKNVERYQTVQDIKLKYNPGWKNKELKNKIREYLYEKYFKENDVRSEL